MASRGRPAVGRVPAGGDLRVVRAAHPRTNYRASCLLLDDLLDGFPFDGRFLLWRPVRPGHEAARD